MLKNPESLPLSLKDKTLRPTHCAEQLMMSRISLMQDCKVSSLDLALPPLTLEAPPPDSSTMPRRSAWADSLVLMAAMCLRSIMSSWTFLTARP